MAPSPKCGSLPRDAGDLVGLSDHFEFEKWQTKATVVPSAPEARGSGHMTHQMHTQHNYNSVYVH